jgi:DNA phosphorothioation-associated putative methyltransferase
MPAPGKRVAGHAYLHLSALAGQDADLRERLAAAEALAGVGGGEDFNVIKFGQDDARLTLLDYPGFFEQGFPELRRYWTVDLAAGSVRFRTYAASLNPPILHRKELLLAPDHPRIAEFAALTAAAEQAGLFDDPVRIGFRQAWDELLERKGYRVAGHALLPLGNDEAGDGAEPAPPPASRISRHLTALRRYGFSAPIQTLARLGFLDGSKSVFDYGCGRGDDLRGLLENGIEAAGWDPYYAPDGEKRPADIVNLGFVINVIEDRDERREAVQGAYALAGELLAVSAMLAHPEAARGTPYGDGVLTARNTFQKYYTQGELRAYLAEALDEEPVAVGPGIFYVFKDKDAEQRFQSGRQENRRNILRLAHLSRPAKPEKPARPARRDQAEEKYQRHRGLLESLWETCLSLGREPDRTEVADPDALAAQFGPLPAALRFVKSRKQGAEAVLEQARQSRMADLKVYFAQLQFEGRKPYRRLESRLQRDVKAFFGGYQESLQAGRELLFAAGQPEAVDAACQEAAERGLGWLEAGESLTLPTAQVVQLPALLRAYVACGLRLYGDAEGADLIKVHIRSGKLTLMSFDDFADRALPRLRLRVKIKLREQSLEVFEYGEAHPPPYLYRKSRYINEECPRYAEQLAFDEALEGLGLFDLGGYGPKPDAFDAGLAAARWAVRDFQLVRSGAIPPLDAPCGRFLSYRDLIECGETQARTGIPNLPQNPESYTALLDLALSILDPVIDYFGMIKLSYGFCSPQLAKAVPGRIAPELDQHAACEPNRRGRPVCARLGAAADFLVEDEDMEEVARWIMANLPFDRLYFYGKDRPVHVSYSPQGAREAYELREAGGRRVPRAFR